MLRKRVADTRRDFFVLNRLLYYHTYYNRSELTERPIISGSELDVTPDVGYLIRTTCLRFIMEVVYLARTNDTTLFR